MARRARDLTEFLQTADLNTLDTLRRVDPIVFGGIGGVRGGIPKRAEGLARRALIERSRSGKAPVEGSGTSDPKPGLDLLKNISRLSGAGRRLSSILAGVESGFGGAHIVRTSDPSGAGLTSVIDIGVMSDPDKRPEIIPAGSGAFAVFPTAGTRRTGQGLITAYQRAADIQQRQTQKIRDYARGSQAIAKGRSRRRKIGDA